jgi:hypothetical protein
MKLFAEYSERKVGLVRVWMKSWTARGWEPQLLSRKEVLEAGNPQKAARARGGGAVGDASVINYGYRARKGAAPRVKQFGKPGWESADLVRFPAGATESQVLECGRCL